MSATRRSNQSGSWPPIYSYEPDPSLPSVTTLRIEAGEMSALDPEHAHAHTFLSVIYFDHGGGSIRLADRDFNVEAGDIYSIAPGEVVGAGEDVAGLARASAWAVYFPEDFIARAETLWSADGVLSWRANPLLLPFVRDTGSAGGPIRVPEVDRSAWLKRFDTLDRELSTRRFGYREAARAYLTLMLTDLARLADAPVRDLQLNEDPILARVFQVIEERFREPLSLRDVALAVNLTPSYLTTLLRRRTGRTVQGWIVERRMAESRRLLVETDLTVDEIAVHVGYRDPSYFIKLFRRDHHLTPLAWRHSSRPAPSDRGAVSR